MNLSTFLTSIGNGLDKRFLFGSMLPAMLFTAAVAVTVGSVAGFVGLVAWLNGVDAMAVAAVSTAGIVVLFAFAYVLSALRGLLLDAWAGRLPGLELLYLPGLKWHTAWHNYRREAVPRVWWKTLHDDFRSAVYDADRAPVDETDVADFRLTFRYAVRPGQPAQAAALPPWRARLQRLLRRRRKVEAGPAGTPTPEDLERWIKQLRRGGKRVERDALIGEFVAAYRAGATPALNATFSRVAKELVELSRRESAEISAARISLDRDYGTGRNLRGTALGNIIEAYEAYPATRYGIEGAAFWPRLLAVMPAGARDGADDAHVLLDFAVTTASLASLYTLLVLYGGPLLGRTWAYWWPLVAAGVLATAAANQIAVRAALEYGEQFRTCFDLYRGQLLTALGAADVARERVQWEELSALVVYARQPPPRPVPPPASASPPASATGAQA